METLIESISPDVANIITETAADGKNMYLNGIFMQAGIKNQNGRIYPLGEMTVAVDTASKLIQERNGIFGELDHPSTLQLNLDRISHVVTELRMDSNNVIGKAKLLETPMGLIAKELVKSGVRIGVSSRGAGNVTESGDVSGFSLVTIDIVATPSAPDAMPAAVYESLLASRFGGETMTLAKQVKEDPAAQKYFKKAFMKFLKEDLFKK